MAALLCIAFYTLLVGAGASAVRAALMGGIALFAVPLSRRQVERYHAEQSAPGWWS